MKTKNNLGVALVKELCPICSKKIDGPIVLNTYLTSSSAKKVEEMNGKIIGWSKEPCKKCKEDLDKAFLFIGIDDDKSNKKDGLSGIYRTGQIIGTKKDIPLVQEFVKNNSPKSYKLGYTFMDYRIMKKLNLIQD